MKDFLEDLGRRKAEYYFELYKSGRRAERREECLKRVRMIDEYMLLLDIIEYLPNEMKKQVDEEYKISLENISIWHGR